MTGPRTVSAAVPVPSAAAPATLPGGNLPGGFGCRASLRGLG